MANRWGKLKTETDFIFLGSKITVDLTTAVKLKDAFLRRKAMRNLDSVLKSRDISLPKKVHIVKAMVFPVVMYGCKSWAIKKKERKESEVAQLYPTLCNLMDCSLSGSSVHGIFQARVME